MVVGFDHFAKLRLVAAIAAVAIGVIAADEFGIPRAQRTPVRLKAQSQRVIGPAIGGIDAAPRCLLAFAQIIGPRPRALKWRQAGR